MEVKRHWELHRLLNNRKGSLSSTCKKNTEANTKVYDFNQKTMQALDVLAEEYEIFEETMKKVTHETEDGDMLFAVAYELEKAQKEQDRVQDELEATRESMDTASGYGLQGSQQLPGTPRCHVYRSEEGVPKDRRTQRKSRRAMSTSYERTYEVRDRHQLPSEVFRMACQRSGQRHSRPHVWRP